MDRARGHRSLAAACEAGDGTYARRLVLYHCAEAGEWDAFTRLATDLAHLDARFAMGSGEELALDLGRAYGAPRSASVAPFERLVLKEMPMLQRERGAIHQLACQQPDGSAVFKAWCVQPRSARHMLWRNKPQTSDPCMLTMQFGGAVCGFGLASGRYVVGAGKNVEVRYARNGALIEVFEGDSDVLSVAVAEWYFCAGYQNNTIKVWDSGER